MTSDNLWPWYMTFDLINILRNPIASLTHLTAIRLQLFKAHPNYENQHFPPNLTSDDPWPWYMIFDFINIWRKPYCIFDPGLVVIELRLFKGDPDNKILTKLEHTHSHTRTHTHTQIWYRNIPMYCFSSQGDKNHFPKTKEFFNEIWLNWSRRTWIDLHYKIKFLKNYSVSKWQPKNFLSHCAIMLITIHVFIWIM